MFLVTARYAAQDPPKTSGSRTITVLQAAGVLGSGLRSGQMTPRGGGT